MMSSIFHLLICHLYVFFGEVSVQVFGPLFNRAVGFLFFCFFFIIEAFKSSLDILDSSPLTDVYFSKMFSQ